MTSLKKRAESQEERTNSTKPPPPTSNLTSLAAPHPLCWKIYLSKPTNTWDKKTPHMSWQLRTGPPSRINQKASPRTPTHYAHSFSSTRSVAKEKMQPWYLQSTSNPVNYLSTTTAQITNTCSSLTPQNSMFEKGTRDWLKHRPSAGCVKYTPGPHDIVTWNMK